VGITLDETTPLPDPWHDPSYWVEAGPLESLLSSTAAPQTPHWRVMMFTSTDGQQWSEGTFIAHSFYGLDLLIYNDVIILTGVPQSLPTDGEHIYALTSTRSVGWGSHAWPIAGPDGLADASLHRSANGTIRAIYTTDDQGLSVAVRQGAEFIEEASTVMSEEALTDPTGCRWQGLDYLFATRPSSSLISASSADGIDYVEDDRFVWDGVQAPHCFVEDDTMWLLAQTGGGFGLPKYRVMEDNGEFGPVQNLMSPGTMPFDSCTTPVLDRFGEDLLLFCASWWE